MRSKILRGTPKHLSQTGQLQGFTYLMLNLPFRCNYRCLKCFDLIDNQPITTGVPITLEEILRKIAEAKDLGGKVIVIAGEGEPALDPNIYRIVSYINELGMIPIVYSNGSPLDLEIASFYRDKNACIVIALDSLRPEVYQFLTGNNTLPLVLKNLVNLRRVYADTIEENGNLRIIRLALNMTICSRNKGEIEQIKVFAGKDMYFVSNPLLRWGNAAGNWDVLIDSGQELIEHQHLIRRYSESGGPLTLDSTGVCGYSINGIGIGPLGHYMTCAYTTKTNGLLGTIRERSLAEVYEFKTVVEREHYQNYGKIPCLVRAKSFDIFVETLRSKGRD